MVISQTFVTEATVPAVVYVVSMYLAGRNSTMCGDEYDFASFVV